MKMKKKSRFLCTASLAVIVWTLLVSLKQTKPGETYQSRAPLAAAEVDCVPPGIDAFPGDFLTQDQRRKGGVIIHIAIVCYACAMIAIVCDYYFVPALEAITNKLQLSPDVAGASFMAMGASAPELFSSIAGSFITEDDIGLGAILGSAVFNILGISGIVGMLIKNEALTIQRYPVIRDCTVYGLTVLVLGYVISDNVVQWWEAFILLMIYFSYIILMHYNRAVEKAVGEVISTEIPMYILAMPESILTSFVVMSIRMCHNKISSNEEKDPLLEIRKKEGIARSNTEEKNCIPVNQQEVSLGNKNSVEDNSPENGGHFCASAFRLLMWLPSLLFCLTIPPVGYYPATFIMSIVWMGALSYVTVWMVTIIGYTFSIPDAVSGLTLLAASSSVPDLISTIIIARSGEGNMAISNLLGSNTFDLAFCLGVPWLLKTLISGSGRLFVYSSAMIYTTSTLLLNLLALLLIFQVAGWRLNKISGAVCLALYFLFITLACLYELNVFGEINLPTCS